MQQEQMGITELTVRKIISERLPSREHGPGCQGTGPNVETTRREENGIIITETKFDITGLSSVATANDVIGSSAAGSDGYAFIGQNLLDKNGVIFKTEFICLETPTGGDNDVNVVANSSGTLAQGSAGGTTYLSNSGDLLAGQMVENLLPALTANHYFYLTAGTGDTAGTYTAGQYILRTYGHKLLA